MNHTGVIPAGGRGTHAGGVPASRALARLAAAAAPALRVASPTNRLRVVTGRRPSHERNNFVSFTEVLSVFECV